MGVSRPEKAPPLESCGCYEAGLEGWGGFGLATGVGLGRGGEPLVVMRVFPFHRVISDPRAYHQLGPAPVSSGLPSEVHRP